MSILTRLNDLGQFVSFLVRICTLSPELIRQFAELELVTGTLTAAQAGLATSFAGFIDKFVAALPTIGAIAGAIAAVGAAAIIAHKDMEANDFGYAVQETQEEVKALEDLKVESERTAAQIHNLNEQKANGDFTQQQQIELELLKAQRQVLQDQINLYKGRVDAAKDHERDVARRTANNLLNPSEDDKLYGSTIDQALISYSFARDKLKGKPDNAGYNRLFEHASEEVLRNVETINKLIASLDPEKDKDIVDGLSAKLNEINSVLGVTENVAYDAVRGARDLIAEAYKIVDIASLKDKNGGFIFTANENKQLAKFKKQLQSLRVDIVKTLGEGKTLTEEQSQVFDQWITKMGFVKDDTETLINLFATFFNSAPPDTITTESVVTRLQVARANFEKLMDEVSDFDIDFNRKVYGNIDVNNRQMLEWTEANLNRFRDALDSWRNPEKDGDLASVMERLYGTTSPIMGASDVFDSNKGQVQIAFTPILETPDGPELLSSDSVHTYIKGLLDQVTEKGVKTDWTFDDLLKLDATGFEIDGKKIKGLIADIGDQAQATGEILQYVGRDGSIQQWVQELGNAASSAFAYMRHYILDNVGSLGSLKDEINNVSKALQEYQSIIAGGDPADQANQFSAAWKKAMDDIDKGRINTNAVWGAAKLFFTDEQLAKWHYDLNRIAQELNSDFIRHLFAPPGEGEEAIDPGVKFAQYIKSHASQFSAAHIIGDPNNGTFTFWYDSLEKLAAEFGMSEEAVVSMLHALEAFGVHSTQSGEDVAQLAQKYDELYRITKSASQALHDLVLGFASGDNPLNEAEIMSNLKTLRANGVITGDDEEFSRVIKDVMDSLHEVDEETATPHVWLEGAEQTEADARNLKTALETIFANPISVKLIADTSDVTNKANAIANGSSGANEPGHAAGTKDAAAGVSLVNELGPELISDNGVAYIANGGKPGFTYLNKGAIVFTAEETQKIFRNNHANIPVRSFANGTGSDGRKSIRDRLINGGNARAFASGTQRCPACGNLIKAGHTGACPWCKTQLSNGQIAGYSKPSTPSTPSTPSSPSSSVYVGCPNCGYSIYRNYTGTCPKCHVQLKNGQIVDTSGSTGGQNSNTGSSQYQSCPNCGASVYRNLTGTCWNCGAQLKNGKLYKYTPVTTSTPSYNNSNYTSPGNYNFGKYFDSLGQGGSGGTGGGSSGYTGGGGGTSVGGADYGSQAEPEKVDWIAVLLNRIQKSIAALEKIASSGFKSLSTRFDAAKKEISAITKEIAEQESGYKRYLQEAEGVGLSADIAKLVQDGKIDITEYDEETRELIDKYTTWYEKALDCKYAVEELHQEIADLYQDMFNYTQTDFENQLSLIEHSVNLINSNMSAATAQGFMDSAEYYRQLSELEVARVAKLNDELAELTEKFDDAMASGEIEEYSEAWYAMQKSIQAVEESIADANVQLLQYKKTMRDIEWGYFDYAMEQYNQLGQEANFLIGLMANDRLFGEDGRFDSKGTATMGLRVMNYNAAMAQAEEYAREMRKIEEEIAKNPYDKELIARRQTLLGLQMQSIQAAESEKDAMKDLVSQGIQLELSYLKELIDSYEKSLDSAKD